MRVLRARAAEAHTFVHTLSDGADAEEWRLLPGVVAARVTELAAAKEAVHTLMMTAAANSSSSSSSLTEPPPPLGLLTQLFSLRGPLHSPLTLNHGCTHAPFRLQDVLGLILAAKDIRYLYIRHFLTGRNPRRLLRCESPTTPLPGGFNSAYL
jgi:hypothetical protein